MHTFFSEERRGDYLFLRDKELKHLKVRRIEQKEKFKVIYEDRTFLCELERLHKDKAQCRILEELPQESFQVNITLYQAVPENLKTFEEIIRGSVQVGVKRIVPVISDRSFKRREVLERKLQRWEKIAKEEMKLSGRSLPFRIEKVESLRDLKAEAQVNLLLDNFNGKGSIRDLNFKAQSYSVVVGPEGGFTAKEVSSLRERGFEPVLLRPYVMRTQTAALLMCGMIANLSAT